MYFVDNCHIIIQGKKKSTDTVYVCINNDIWGEGLKNVPDTRYFRIMQINTCHLAVSMTIIISILCTLDIVEYNWKKIKIRRISNNSEIHYRTLMRDFYDQSPIIEKKWKKCILSVIEKENFYPLNSIHANLSLELSKLNMFTSKNG